MYTPNPSLLQDVLFPIAIVLLLKKQHNAGKFLLGYMIIRLPIIIRRHAPMKDVRTK